MQVWNTMYGLQTGMTNENDPTDDECATKPVCTSQPD
jgi:hypothetical protein